MPLTMAMVTEKLAALEQQEKQALAQLNAIAGAKSVLEALKAEADKDEDEPAA